MLTLFTETDQVVELGARMLRIMSFGYLGISFMQYTRHYEAQVTQWLQCDYDYNKCFAKSTYSLYLAAITKSQTILPDILMRFIYYDDKLGNR